MTRNQRYALAILKQWGEPGVVTTGVTGVYDRQPWINWRTAYSLHDRGLVVVKNYGEEDAEVYLVGPAALNGQAASRGARKPAAKRSKSTGPTSPASPRKEQD